MPPKISKPLSTFWLLKAEPDSRIVKGIDVKFSAQDFEEAKTTNWEGVRSHQAKCILRDQIKLNQKCLFYASNTKVPGITALSYCSKEGFPDFNAWDPLHPYYDPKSSSDSPTWFMVELTFIRHLPHLVSLKLLQYLATLNDPPDCLPYLTKAGLEGIKEMKLLRGGRLSVQPVEEIVYGAIGQLGMKGGWEGIDLKKEIEKSKPKVNKTKTNSKNEDEEEVEEEQEEEPKKVVKTRAVAKKVTKPKVKAEDDDDDDEEREEEEDDEEKVVKKQKVVKKPRVSAAKSTKEPKARRSEWWQTE